MATELIHKADTITPLEAYSVKIRPDVDGALPPDTAEIKIGFSSSKGSKARTLAITSDESDGLFTASWNATSTFENKGETLTGAWEVTVASDKTAALLTNIADKRSALQLSRIYMYVSVDGRTVSKPAEILVIGAI
ncbi:MAG: hypothetical protein AAFV72_00290 [Cyanobacteria bacterium J06635_1]